jgi:predicted Zn-ribbon and HTH transcriptional regulator
MPSPEVIYNFDRGAMIECPDCKSVGYADADQYRGEVSIDCPECDYHETHDLRDTDHE